MIHNNNNYNSYRRLTHTPRDEGEIIHKKILFLENMDHLDQSPTNGVPTPFVMIQPFGSAWINVDQRAGTFSIQGTQTGHDNSCPRKYGSFGSTEKTSVVSMPYKH